MAYIKAGSVRGATISSKAVDYNHLATSINQTESFLPVPQPTPCLLASAACISLMLPLRTSPS